MKTILFYKTFLILGLSAITIAQGQNFVEQNAFISSATNAGQHATPTFGDLDGDGDMDCLVGVSTGEFYYLENIGTKSTPNFDTPQENPFGLATAGQNTKPTLGDLDGDGDLDLLIGNVAGAYYYAENTGTASSPAFATVQSNPFGLAYISSVSCPTFVDLDGDNDLDVMTGSGNGKNHYFENTGTSTTPTFAAPQENPFALTVHGNWNRHTFGDMDGDGDFDLMMGVGVADKLFYFENTGTSMAPAFAAVQENPFGLGGGGSYLVPFLLDLDNDGDLDIFAGTNTGDYTFFQQTSPIGVNENAFTDATVYPNPTRSEVYLDFGDVQEDVHIRVSNYLGATLSVETYSGQGTYLDLSGKAGVYFIYLETATGLNQTFKIIKQ